MAPSVRWEVPEPIAVCEVRAADGTPIAVRQHGNPKGPRLVLSHGNGLSIDSYYPFWSRFADRFELFIYDFRNHGWNPVGDRRMHNIPTFVGDNECVVRDIDRRFGKKPKAGVFHSLSALTALLQVSRGGGFSALVLFDPPICPPGGDPSDMEAVGRYAAGVARRRRSWFDTPEELAEHLSRAHGFQRVCPAAVDLMARTTLRRAADGRGYELCCPREYEAQVNDYSFGWAMTLDINKVTCAVKVIGADPTDPYSFMPSMDLNRLRFVDYDFIPETTHFLQLEEPEACAALVVEFLEDRGFA